MNKIEMIEKYTLLLWFGCLILIYSCNGSNSQSFDSDLKNCLLFIEDLSGKNGLGAGKYGDIVLFDLDKNKEKILTDDDYYDSYPTYSSLNNDIIFESKREFQTYLSGMAVPSNLFRIDLGTLKISNFSEILSNKFPKLIGSINEKPSYNISGTKLLFINRNGLDSKLLMYDEIKDSILVLIDEMPSVMELLWYEGQIDTLILFNYSTVDKVGRKKIPIIIFNIKTKEYKTISNENWTFNLGDTWGDLLLYSGHEIVENFQNSLFLYNFNTATSQEIQLPAELKNMRGIFAFQRFKNENEIFFIGGNEGNFIYKFNIQTLYYEKIYNNNHIKSDLTYIR